MKIKIGFDSEIPGKCKFQWLFHEHKIIKIKQLHS